MMHCCRPPKDAADVADYAQSVKRASHSKSKSRSRNGGNKSDHGSREPSRSRNRKARTSISRSKSKSKSRSSAGNAAAAMTRRSVSFVDVLTGGGSRRSGNNGHRNGKNSNDSSLDDDEDCLLPPQALRQKTLEADSDDLPPLSGPLASSPFARIATPRVDRARIRLATESWRAISDGETKPFKTYRANKLSGMAVRPPEFFFDTFYKRLFVEEAPEARRYFHVKGKSAMTAQSDALFKMVNVMLRLLDKGRKLRSALLRLADRHNERGIRARHYVVVGRVLMFSVKKCLGPDLASAEVVDAWMNIYSYMLRVMMPSVMAAEAERTLRDMVAKRSKSRASSYDESLHGSDALPLVGRSKSAMFSQSPSGGGVSLALSSGNHSGGGGSGKPSKGRHSASRGRASPPRSKRASRVAGGSGQYGGSGGGGGLLFRSKSRKNSKSGMGGRRASVSEFFLFSRQREMRGRVVMRGASHLGKKDKSSSGSADIASTPGDLFLRDDDDDDDDAMSRGASPRGSLGRTVSVDSPTHIASGPGGAGGGGDSNPGHHRDSGQDTPEALVRSPVVSRRRSSAPNLASFQQRGSRSQQHSRSSRHGGGGAASRNSKSSVAASPRTPRDSNSTATLQKQQQQQQQQRGSGTLGSRASDGNDSAADSSSTGSGGGGRGSGLFSDREAVLLHDIDEGVPVEEVREGGSGSEGADAGAVATSS